MRSLALALSLVVIACGGGGGGGKTAEKPKGEPVSERKAEKDAKSLVTEIYSTIGHSNTDSLMSLVADPVFVLGPRKGDALATRADALVTLRTILDADNTKKLDVRSGALLVASTALE